MVVVLLAAAIGGYFAVGTTRPTSSPELPSRQPLDASLLVAPGRGSGEGGAELVTVVDPAAGSTNVIHRYSTAAGGTSFPWVVSGPVVVGVTGLQFTTGIPQVGTAESFRPSSPGVFRTIGLATTAVVSATPGHVWLVSDPNSDRTLDHGVAGSGCTVEEVSVGGVVVVSPRSYPCAWTIEGPAPGGLLVDRSPALSTPGPLDVWDPRHGRIGPDLSAPTTSGDIDSESARDVLWVPTSCSWSGCPQRFTDLFTGHRSALPPLPKGWNEQSPYVVAPNGPYAAVLTVSDATEAQLRAEGGRSSPCCYYFTHLVEGRLALYNLDTDRLVEFRPLTFFSAADVQWAPDSSYVFVTGDLTHIEAVGVWSATAPIHAVTVHPLVDRRDLQDLTGRRGSNVAESFIAVSSAPAQTR